MMKNPVHPGKLVEAMRVDPILRERVRNKVAANESSFIRDDAIFLKVTVS